MQPLHKHVFLTFLLFSAFSAAISSEKKKECAPTLDSYVAARYGPDYREDKDIRIQGIPKTRFSWVIDNTPSVNPDRILMETTTDASCVVLRAPLANSIFFKLDQNLGLPRSVWTETSVTNDFQKIRINYIKDENKNSYRALKCEKIRQKKKPIEFDCADILAE